MANSRSIGSVAALLLVFGGCSQGSGSKTVGPFPGVARWFSQYHPPTSNNLRAVRASGPNSVIVAGEGTSIHRSDDAGQNWVQLEHVPFGRGGDIVSMDYFGSNLVAVGSDSKFPASGRAWTAINGVLDFVTPDLDASVAAYRCVDVVSSNTSYRLRADDVVEKDVNGTVTLLPALPAGSWNSIDFLGTTDVGYAAGDGGLIAKFDLGVWTPQTTPAAAPMYDLKKIYFASTTEGFACGSLATILRTTNGGTTWTSENYASPGVTFTSLHFPVNATNGWIVGQGGSIVFTVDGGDNWAAQLCPTMEDLHDVYFADNTNGYVVGDKGIVLRTTNGGAGALGWLRAPPTLIPLTLTQLNAVDFTNDGVRGLVGGNDGLLLRTIDGGTNWVPTSTGFGAGTHILGVAVPKVGSGDVAYAVTSAGHILRTLDFGATAWTAVTPPAAAGAVLRAIHFPAGDSIGFAVGDTGKILYTSNGGGLWTAATGVPGTANFKALSSTPGGLTIFASADGSVLFQSSMTTFTTWTAVPAGAPALPGGLTLRALTSPASGTLFAGAGDTVHRNLVGSWSSGVPFAGTVVEGLSWKSATGGFSEDVYGVATGTGRGVFYTTDGGTTWLRSYVHTNNDLHAIWMSPTVPGLGCVVGDNSTILRTTTGGK